MGNQKSVYLIFGIFLFLTIKVYPQKYDKSTIDINDLKKGITNLSYLRATLLEKGFIFNNKDSNSEFWNVPVDGGDPVFKDIFSQIAIQISTWKYKARPFSKQIIINIRKDLLPKYNEGFFNQVIEHFPKKRAEPIKSKHGDEPEKDAYILIYYNPNSKITVEFSEDDTWAKYTFNLSL